MWKVVIVIINCFLATYIALHDVPHVFRVGHVTGISSLKAKLLQKLTSMREEVLYTTFLDLHKTYDILDRSRCLEILERYSVGPRACPILRTY